MEQEEILAEIKRTALENGGKPLGKDRFTNATGIKEYEWQRYWPRFSEAQVAAGFSPNQFLKEAYSDDYLITCIINLARELGHFPVKTEMRIKKRSDPTFPNDKAFDRRFRNKSDLVAQVLRYSSSKTDYQDVIELLKPLTVESHVKLNAHKEDTGYGFVYLVRGHPGEYKIGRTNLVDRRLSELGATASVEQQLVHEIKTDDPAGIESYWHKRFQDKRMRGEWFRLTADDVRAFQRWRKIY